MDNIDHSKIEPIFVIGTPRSGTTLTAKILNQHSKIFMPGETHFFDDIYFRKDEFGNPADSENRKKIIDRLSSLYDRYYEPDDQERINSLIKNDIFGSTLHKQGTSYINLFTTFMSIQMQAAGKCRWGNNAPRDIFNIEQIIEFFPHAKIIVCVRDIRAFLLSYKGKWRVTGDAHSSRLKKLYHPVITSMLWKTSMGNITKINKLVSKNNLIIVKYEDLVTKPKDTTNNICLTIGEDFENNMLNIESNNSSSSDTKTGIFTSSLDTWQTKLSAEEVFIAQFIARKEMQQLGYKVKKASVSWPLLIYYILTTPLSLAQALIANRNMYTNPISFLYRRLSVLANNPFKNN